MYCILTPLLILRTDGSHLLCQEGDVPLHQTGARKRRRSPSRTPPPPPSTPAPEGQPKRARVQPPPSLPDARKHKSYGKGLKMPKRAVADPSPATAAIVTPSPAAAAVADAAAVIVTPSPATAAVADPSPAAAAIVTPSPAAAAVADTAAVIVTPSPATAAVADPSPAAAAVATPSPATAAVAEPSPVTATVAARVVASKVRQGDSPDYGGWAWGVDGQRIEYDANTGQPSVPTAGVIFGSWSSADEKSDEE